MSQEAKLEPHAQLKPSRARPVAVLLVACLVVLAGTALLPPVTARLRNASRGGRPVHAPRDAADAAHHCPAIADTPAAFPASFWFVKVPKTGGTTVAGVLRTVAAHHGVHALEVSRANKGAKTLASFNSTLRAAWSVLGGRQTALGITGHLPFDDAKAALLRQSSAAGLLLFTAVRHPVAHFHSHFFHHRCYLAATSFGIQRERGYACDIDERVLAAARAGDTLEARWQFARQPGAADAQFDYVRGSNASSSVAEVAARYDFLFVTERMNEALVTFMLLHGLRFQDIAHLSSKNRTGKYEGPAHMPAELNAFVANRSRLDLDLWQLANARLDAQRRQLQQQCDGADVVGATLVRFERLLSRVRRECADVAAWHAAHGLARHPLAYRGDTGLGHRCARHVARRFREEETEV